MEIIDYTQCTLPENHLLYQISATYGREFKVYVSARSAKEAKQVFYGVYDRPYYKILSVEFISDDTTKRYDRSKNMILGKLDIIVRKTTKNLP